MDLQPLNRPLASYLVVQSSLVLVALAASHLLHAEIVARTGVEVSRLSLGIVLVLLTQLPVAAMYARNETRNLTSEEGWILGTSFVAFTVLAESSFQAVVLNFWPVIAERHGLGPHAAQDALVFVVCMSLMTFLMCSAIVSLLFRLAVRNNLCGGARGKLKRPERRRKLRILERALCVLSAGLAGIGFAWVADFGWTMAYGMASAVLVFGAFYAALPRARTGGSIRWEGLTREILPLTLTCAMTYATTLAGIKVLAASGSGGNELVAAFLPALAGVDSVTLAAVATQMSGVLLGLLCANVVVIWMFVALIRPILAGRSTRARSLPAANASPMLVDVPEMVDTALPREEALAMIRTARELMAERTPLRPRKVKQRPASS